MKKRNIPYTLSSRKDVIDLLVRVHKISEENQDITTLEAKDKATGVSKQAIGYHSKKGKNE